MILHHYELSPYSEKIRLMMGYAGQSWQSVICPEMPPRPSVDPLAGGYRRIPVAQSGADVFCDSRLICEEIAGAAGKPELAPSGVDAAARDFAKYCEDEMFLATVVSIPGGLMLRQAFRKMPFMRACRFFIDRAGMSRKAARPAPTPAQARVMFDAHIADLEERLHRGFLFSDTPCVADFCAYHTLWFKTVVAEQEIFEDLPRLRTWYHRMTAFGHGKRREIDPDNAFAAARDSEPRPIGDNQRNHVLIGQRVSIGPADYGMDAVEGTLVGCYDNRWVFFWEAGDMGTVHVHFPTRGYTVRELG